MKIKLPSYLKVLLKLAITAAALFFVFRKIDFREMGGHMLRSDPWLLLVALGLFILSKAVSSVRLNRYLQAIGIRITERSNMKLYLLGMYYNLFLPGGIGGDGYKIYLLTKKFSVKTSRIFWAVLMDRFIGVLALFCMVVGGFYFVDLLLDYRVFIWALIPLGVLAAWLVFRIFFPYLLKVFLITNLQSLVVQVLQLVSAWLILLALGHQQQPEAYLLVFLVSSIVAVLPVTIGGIGSREFTFMLGARWLHLDLNLSIALSLLFYLITAFTSLWGIIYSLGPGINLAERQVRGN